MNSKLMKVGALGVFFFMASQVQAQKTDTKPKKDTETVIDDVVVIGYKTQKKSTNTSSASTVSDAQLKDQNTSNIGDMLQGKAVGLTVNVSGNPDENPGINIRGFASLYGGTGPLWVVDGVIIGTDQPNSLDPNQIESVTVLKDAASTALYGSTGANGVIVVTTKQGKKNSSNLSFSMSNSFSTPNLGNFKMLDGKGMMDYYDTMRRTQTNLNDLANAQIAKGLTPDYDVNTDFKWYDERPTGNPNKYNWFDKAFGTGVTNNYNLSYSGGTEKSKTYISLGYISEDYMIKDNKKDSYFFRLNHDYEVTSRITLKPKVSVGYYTYNSQSRGVTDAYTTLPWDSPYGANGQVIDPSADQTLPWFTRDRRNTYYDLQWNTVKRSNLDLLGAFEAEVKLFSNLKFVTNNSINRIYTEKDYLFDPRSNSGKLTGGRFTQQNIISTTRFANQMLKFDDKFGNHNVNALFAYEFRDTNYDDRTYNTTNIVQDKTGLETASTAQKPLGNIVQKARQSLLFNAEYDYANKYFVQVSARRDGASQFGVSTNPITKKNVYGNFYAISGGWNIHKEDFLKNNKAINELKLRASYGKVGNLPNEAYNHFTYYSLTGNYNNVAGGILSNIANDDYTWETTKQTNLGLNLGLYNRVRFSADVYRNNTDGLLVFVALPMITGQYQQLRNVGSLQNKGLEFTLSADIIKQKDYKWTVDANWSKNINKLTSFNNGKPQLLSMYLKEGYDINTFALREWAGVDARNGKPQWYKADGSITNDYNQAEIRPVASSTPDFLAGFNSSLKIHGVTLDVNLYGSFGGKILNEARGQADSDGNYPKNVQTALNDGWVRWEKPGDVATHPAAVYGNLSLSNNKSSRYLEDGSFIKIRSIRLGYEVPKQYLESVYAKSLNIYLSAENVHTFTKYSGISPETGVGNAPGEFKNRPGFGGETFPNPRRFTFGMNINF